MKVLIVNPSRFYSGYPAGGDLGHLLVLYSYIRNHCPGVEVDVLDLQRELSLPETDAAVAAFMKLARAALAATGFDVVGISCWTSMHYLSTVAIAELCKELNPECTVVVGGYHPSAVPHDFSYPGTPVDYVVTGEGEIAFKRIIDGEIPREQRPQIVAGVQVDTGGEQLLWEEYRYYRNATNLQLWLTRGCPFSCGYCLDRNTKWRGYTPARAVDEISRLQAMFPRLELVSILDPVFGLNKGWRREFLAGLQAADLGLRYWSETRVDVLEEADVAQLGALNFQMDVGLDACTPRMAEIMMKARDPHKYLEAFWRTDEWMNRHKVFHLIYLIFNYPGETSATLDEALAFWTKYYTERQGTYGICTSQGFSFFPGNEFYHNLPSYAERYGTRVLQPEWWKVPRGPQIVRAKQVIPSSELLEAGKLSHYQTIQNRIQELAGQAASDYAKEQVLELLGARPKPLVTSYGYFNDKRLEVSPSTVLHRRLSTQQVFYNFDRSDTHLCSREETLWLDGLLQQDRTVGELARQQAAFHPDPEAARRKREKFLQQMLYRQFLRVRVPAPGPAPRGRVAIATTLGTMTFELLADEAPRTVAAFVAAARGGYYDQLFFLHASPGAFVEAGCLLPDDVGPGQLQPPEQTPRRHERGALSMNVAAHMARFAIARRCWPELDERLTVFGLLVEGEEVLDGLLSADAIMRVDVAEAPAGVAAEAGREPGA